MIDNHVRERERVPFWPSFRILQGPDHFKALEYATRRRCTCHQQFRNVTRGFAQQRSNQPSMAIESPTGKTFSKANALELRIADNKGGRSEFLNEDGLPPFVCVQPSQRLRAVCEPLICIFVECNLKITQKNGKLFYLPNGTKSTVL